MALSFLDYRDAYKQDYAEQSVRSSNWMEPCTSRKIPCGAIAKRFVNVSTSEKRLRDRVDMEMHGDVVADIEADPLGNVGRAWKEGASGGNAATIDDALRVHRILDAIKRSAEEGKTIRL